MAIENGEWYMQGLSWDNPMRIRTWEELVNWVDEVGFLPLFANEIEGFSAEEHVSPDFWWTGIEDQDPWAWREIIARSCRAAYGKFFAGKAGFISLRWLPFFANYRREGYDFDSRWEDGKASRREKNIMDLLTDRDGDGDVIWTRKELLSTEIKKKAGFGKGGEKNFPGMMTGLQMQTYLVITDFRRRRNKKGDEYGMAVSIPNTPEAVWGYDLVSSAYTEAPEESWRRICSRVKEVFPGAAEGDIIRLMEWAKARDELVEAIRFLGFPEELGYDIAKELGSPRAMARMCVYLYQVKPRSVELVVDEMLSIRSEIDAWRRKKEAQEANAAYNAMLYRGFPGKE